MMGWGMPPGRLLRTAWPDGPLIFGKITMSFFILHRILGWGDRGGRGPAGALLLVLAGLLAACGGGGGGGASPPPMVTLTSIAVAAANPSFALGTTDQLTATGSYSDGTKKDLTSQVTWAATTAGIVTINTAGLASTVAVGQTAITATMNGVMGNGNLTVTAATVISIAITPAKPTIAPGKTLQFTATGTYTDTTTKDLTASVAWAASPSSVATIDPATGLASSVGAGTASISGTYSGGPAITPVTLTVSATVYAYATNFDAGTVSQYMISPGGALSALTPPTVAAGASPFSVSVELTGQYVYVANYNADTVSQYAIGATGALTPLGTPAVMTGSHPNGVTIDPPNKHAYVANFGDNTVSQYNIGTTGALTPMGTPTVATGSFPASIVISPNGKYAYVADYACTGPGCAAAQGTISQYTVGADGALTAMSPAMVNTGSATSQPNSLIVDPTNSFLFVANAGDNTVSQFAIGASGALTLVGSPVPTGGTIPFSITVDPSGHVYTANSGSNNISQFSIVGGVLTSITAPVAAGIGVSSVTVDPTGTYAYATNRGESSLSQYTIGVNGALMPMPTPTAPAGLHPTSIATGY
jgi:6-phosphogluconolactonase (cycloisomerase 2 family)